VCIQVYCPLSTIPEKSVIDDRKNYDKSKFSSLILINLLFEHTHVFF